MASWNCMLKGLIVLDLYTPITRIVNTKDIKSLRKSVGLHKLSGGRAGHWINLQSKYDLAVVEQNIGAKVIAEVEQATV